MKMEKSENVCTGDCGCSQKCGGCGYNHMHLMKKLIKMALVIIILCFAFKIGEIKGMMEQAYGHGFMDGNFRYGRGNMMLYGGANQDGNWQVTMPMMNWQETNTTTPATKSTTATPTKK